MSKIFQSGGFGCWVLMALAVASCGGSVVVEEPDGGAGMAGGGAGGGKTGPCPQAEPTPGIVCTPKGLECSYGDSPISDCRRSYSCTGTWAVAMADCPLVDPVCATAAPANGSACTAKQAAECASPDGTLCDCSCGYWGGVCVSGKTGTWFCTPPPAGCPTLIPNKGTSCSTPGQQCKYGGCGDMAVCKDSVWTWAYNPCPQ